MDLTHVSNRSVAAVVNKVMDITSQPEKNQAGKIADLAECLVSCSAQLKNSQPMQNNVTFLTAQALQYLKGNEKAASILIAAMLILKGRWENNDTPPLFQDRVCAVIEAGLSSRH